MIQHQLGIDLFRNKFNVGQCCRREKVVQVALLGDGVCVNDLRGDVLLDSSKLDKQIRHSGGKNKLPCFLLRHENDEYL